MKTLISLTLLFSVVMLSQTWNNPVTINNVSSNTQIASCVNKNGIHAIYWTSGGNLQYVKINADGSHGSAVTIDNSIGLVASITSYNDDLYAVYEKSGVIKIARSTNNGVNWNTSFASRNTIASTVRSIATTSDSRGIHIAWSEQYSEVYYERYQFSVPTGYYDFKNVTDGTNEDGAMVSIALSSNKVHIGYSRSDGSYLASDYDRTRDFIWSTNTWEATSTVLRDPYHNGGCDLTRGALMAVAGSTIHVISYGASSLGPTKKLLHCTRPVDGTTWTYDSNLNEEYLSSYVVPLKLAVTANGNLHMIFRSNDYNYGFKHLVFNGTSWSNITPTGGVTSSLNDDQPYVIGSGNDLYAVYKHDLWPQYVYELTYRQYDAAPTAPQNPVTSVINVNGENYPKVTWSVNPEPDVYSATNGYEVWRRDDNTGSGNWTAWTLKATLSGSTTQYTDFELIGAGFGPKHHEYKLRAKDIGTNLSNYSSVVTIRSGAGLQKHSTLQPKEYILAQNFPNPFNPSTTFRFALPTDQQVALKVYDLLGKEVATVVNSFRQAGYYQEQFDASFLPSGVYVYRFTAGKFSSVGKMMLLR